MDPLPSYVRIHPTMLKQSTTQVHFHHVKSSSIDDANESYISQNKQSSVIIFLKLFLMIKLMRFVT